MGGLASRTIGDQGTTDPGGELVVRGDVSRLGSCRWGAGLDTQPFQPLGSHSTTDHGRNRQKLPDRTEGVLGSENPMLPISPTEMDRGSWSVVPQVSRARRHRRGMRPAGGIRPFPQRVNNELLDGGGGGTKVMPLSVEADEFSSGRAHRVEEGPAVWFLTGWVEDMEVEFMIDTGCQVTILATSVFKRMCAADPQVRSRLRRCGRRLVSADLSQLTVKGELKLKVVFPGLS